jgi:sugar phosphate isomerase/epimerase
MGLEVSCLIAWGGNVDLGEAEGLAENVAWGKRINETAADMAGGLWMAHVGVMPEDTGSAHWARFRDSLAEIAAHGEKVGATLAMETGPEPPVLVRRMIEEVGSGALRVNFDPANLLIWPPYLAKRDGTPFDFDAAMARFNPVEGLRTLIPYVVHVHAKDSVMRRDCTFDEVPLGTGMTNWPELHRIFVASGYSGYYAIERECGEDAMGDVRKAVEYLRGL